MVEEIVIVKMAQMKVVKRDGKTRLKLKTTLGSCVGLVLSDSSEGIHGLAHIMLPYKIKKDNVIGKYADTAIPSLIRVMEQRGAKKNNMKAYIVGGASMFSGTIGNGIGEKNIQSTKKMLDKLGIPVIYMETGGNQGRTVIFDVDEEQIVIKLLPAQ